MIKSVLTPYDAIQNLLDSMGNVLFEDVYTAMSTKAIKLLEPFKEASDMIEQDKELTRLLELMYRQNHTCREQWSAWLSTLLLPAACSSRTSNYPIIIR